MHQGNFGGRVLDEGDQTPGGRSSCISSSEVFCYEVAACEAEMYSDVHRTSLYDATECVSVCHGITDWRFRWYFRFAHVLDLFAFSTIREKFPWPAMRQNSVALSCLLFIGRAVLICHFLLLESPRAVASTCPQMACAVSDPSFVDRHELRTLSARSFCCRS